MHSWFSFLCSVFIKPTIESNKTVWSCFIHQSLQPMLAHFGKKNNTLRCYPYSQYGLSLILQRHGGLFIQEELDGSVTSATLYVVCMISGALNFEVSLSLSVHRYDERFGLQFIGSGNRAAIKYLTLSFLTNLVQGSFCLVNVVSIHHANSRGNVEYSCSRTKARYYGETAWAEQPFGRNVTVGDCGVMFTKCVRRGRSPLSVKEVRRGSKKDGIQRSAVMCTCWCRRCDQVSRGPL